jgi:ABC-type dipeptide/oligopeptide/nickel transport system permease subunit
MDEKTRLSRFTIGLGVSLVLAVIAGAFFGLLGVSLALGAGLLVTMLLGGGMGKR